MQKVKVEDAVGMVLAYDLTKVVPGIYKGPAFKKGYIIKAEDIEELKNIGKNHIYVVSLTEAEIHENEAAQRIAKVISSNSLTVSNPAEGKSNILSKVNGLLKVNQKVLLDLNHIPNIAIVTLHNNTTVKEGQPVATAKVIPLTMEKTNVEAAEQICRQTGPIVDVLPFHPLKTGIIVTGTEVYEGRIQDRFGALLKEKISAYGAELLELYYAPDDTDFIYQKMIELLKNGAEIILVSGGMAVDADDVTPQAIQKMAWDVVTYGVPVLPGAMCMVAYNRQVPIIGIPACAMFSKTTVLDLILPKILAKEHIQKDDLISLAHGGMCLKCDQCHYPICPFGK